jgi:hypothetical protein
MRNRCVRRLQQSDSQDDRCGDGQRPRGPGVLHSPASALRGSDNSRPDVLAIRRICVIKMLEHD